MKKNRDTAFTLAEVLITLGIIGVVAAMTMPTLINSTNKKELETGFKTGFSLVSQAVTEMANNNLDIRNMYCSASGGYRDSTENIFIRDFATHFKVVKSEYGNTANLQNLGYKQSSFSQSARGNFNFNADSHDNGAIILSNGMMIASSGCWWKTNGVGIDFIIDTNGAKRPNKFGYDVFYFQIGVDGHLMPSTGNYIFAPADEDMKKCCNFEAPNTCMVPQDTGVTCASFAIRNQNPNDDTESYWENLP